MLCEYRRARRRGVGGYLKEFVELAAPLQGHLHRLSVAPLHLSPALTLTGAQADSGKAAARREGAREGGKEGGSEGAREGEREC
eukprot:1726939-Rhodomonas_salina.2